LGVRDEGNRMTVPQSSKRGIRGPRFIRARDGFTRCESAGGMRADASGSFFQWPFSAIALRRSQIFARRCRRIFSDR
jgi:hypothetical protein